MKTEFAHYDTNTSTVLESRNGVLYIDKELPKKLEFCKKYLMDKHNLSIIFTKDINLVRSTANVGVYSVGYSMVANHDVYDNITIFNIVEDLFKLMSISTKLNNDSTTHYISGTTVDMNALMLKYTTIPYMMYSENIYISDYPSYVC